MNKASVIVNDSRFPAGAKLSLTDRLGGTAFHPGARALKTATVDKLGQAEFKGLPEGATYYVSGEDHDGETRAVAVQAKVGSQKQAMSAAAIRDQLAQTRPVQTNKTIVTGPRSTTTSRVTGRQGDTFASDAVGKSTPEGEKPLEPHPAPRQEDATGPQRSDTLTGSAEPTSPDEPQPSLRQDQVPKGTPQRSDTPLGEATIIPEGEVQPAQKQEDAPKGLLQRSDTPHGQVEPLPAELQPKERAKPKGKKETRKRGSTSAERSATKRTKRTTAAAKKRPNRTAAQNRTAGKRRAKPQQATRRQAKRK